MFLVFFVGCFTLNNAENFYPGELKVFVHVNDFIMFKNHQKFACPTLGY